MAKLGDNLSRELSPSGPIPPASDRADSSHGRPLPNFVRQAFLPVTPPGVILSTSRRLETRESSVPSLHRRPSARGESFTPNLTRGSPSFARSFTNAARSDRLRASRPRLEPHSRPSAAPCELLERNPRPRALHSYANHSRDYRAVQRLRFRPNPAARAACGSSAARRRRPRHRFPNRSRHPLEIDEVQNRRR